MLKKIGMVAGTILAGLLFIGLFIDKGPPPRPDRVSLQPDLLYLPNQPPQIPEPGPNDPRPTNRRLSEADRTALLHSTIRRHGTPGARDWRDAMRAVIWADYAAVQCPGLIIAVQDRTDIMAAWDLHVGGDTGSAFIQSATQQMVSEARTNKNAFCIKAWQSYGQNGSIASLLRRAASR